MGLKRLVIWHKSKPDDQTKYRHIEKGQSDSDAIFVRHVPCMFELYCSIAVFELTVFVLMNALPY